MKESGLGSVIESAEGSEVKESVVSSMAASSVRLNADNWWVEF